MAKPKELTLTSRQIHELNWFCKNVTGVRQDMYSTIDEVKSFDNRIKRLERTASLIEKFIEGQEKKASEGEG